MLTHLAYIFLAGILQDIIKGELQAHSRTSLIICVVAIATSGCKTYLILLPFLSGVMHYQCL